MQRWIKLPTGAYIDANRVIYVSKVETVPRFDDEGNDAGIGYSIYIGTDVNREHQINITGTKDEILGLMKNLLGAGSPSA